MCVQNNLGLPTLKDNLYTHSKEKPFKCENLLKGVYTFYNKMVLFEKAIEGPLKYNKNNINLLN